MIPHFPQPEFWPAQGHFYVVEQHAYGNGVNCNVPLAGWGKQPSTIWIDPQIPGTTAEPNTLVLLGHKPCGLGRCAAPQTILVPTVARWFAAQGLRYHCAIGI